jgi:hypothetical protein
MDNSFVEEADRLKTHLFSQGPEDAQDACANTEVSNNMYALGNMSTREATMGDGLVSDEEEWEYLQLDDIATKDAKVRKAMYS